MAAPNPLIVPIEVEALVVNDQVRNTSFQRWKADFHGLPDGIPAEPDPFSNNDAQYWNQQESANGVYLQWQLPQALRVGRQDNETTSTTFPLIPNRWLIVRYSGDPKNRIATGWIVESDWLPGQGEKGTSPYIKPLTMESIHIGRKIAVQAWAGETAKYDPYVTAIGPSLLTFSVFQPYNENVLSIHDDLADVAAGTLSYMVVGWYSKDSADPCLKVKNLDALGVGR